MIINTMLVGHVVTAEVIKITEDIDGDTYHCRFLHHTASGSKHLCLDFGQKWNVSEGYEFKSSPRAAARAAEWMKDINTKFVVTPKDVACIKGGA